MRFQFSGPRAWWVQRASAIYMLLFALVLLGSIWLHPPHSYSEWKSWVAHPAMTLAIFVFFAALLSHTWVGLRDVLLDYARPAGVRHFLLGVVGTGLLGTAAWVLQILVRLQS